MTRPYESNKVGTYYVDNEGDLWYCARLRYPLASESAGFFSRYSGGLWSPADIAFGYSGTGWDFPTGLLRNLLWERDSPRPGISRHPDDPRRRIRDTVFQGHQPIMRATPNAIHLYSLPGLGVCHHEDRGYYNYPVLSSYERWLDEKGSHGTRINLAFHLWRKNDGAISVDVDWRRPFNFREPGFITPTLREEVLEWPLGYPHLVIFRDPDRGFKKIYKKPEWMA